MVYQRNKWCSICFAVLSGFYSANQNIIFKGVGELISSTRNGEQGNTWEDPWTYFFLFLLVIFSYLQLSSMNRGLSLWQASKFLPIYNVSLIVMSTTYGAIYYEEYKQLKPIGMFLFPVGLCFISGGVMLLILTAEYREGKDAASDLTPGGRNRSKSELHGPTGAPCPFGQADDTDLESDFGTGNNTPRDPVEATENPTAADSASTIEIEVGSVTAVEDRM